MVVINGEKYMGGRVIKFGIMDEEIVMGETDHIAEDRKKDERKERVFFLARDRGTKNHEGPVFLYNDIKPERNTRTGKWINAEGTFCHFVSEHNGVFDFVKWENEPIELRKI